MESSDLTQDLLDLLFLLQSLNPVQLKALCQFVQNNNLRTSTGGESSPELWIPQLIDMIQRAKPDQITNLISRVTSQFDDDDEQGSRRDVEQLSLEFGIPMRDLEGTFSLVVALYQLQGLLKSLSILQLMKLFETMPPGPPIQQLQLLQQIQQLFDQLQPETLQNLHQKMEEAAPGNEQQTLLQILSLPNEYFQLYQPLRLLLQLDLDELMRLKETLPQLQPVQILQLLQLLQLQPFDVLELRNLLAPSDLDDDGMEDGLMESEMSHHGAPMDTPPAHHSDKKLTIQIVEQPPEKSVYKRNLKPNPMVMLVGDQKLNDGNLYVVATLVRCDTFTEEPKFITGNRPVRVTSGRVITFRKLKITTTSHQQQETLFCIRFELRRYSGASEDEFETLDSVHSNPICVLSHSTQMKPVPAVAPSITEVIPAFGPTTGGTRVAILGLNFADSPAARIRFDNTDVMPIFHGPGTLICHTPQHGPGSVPVRVCNSNKKWSDTIATFTYDENMQSYNDPIHVSGVSSRPSQTDSHGKSNNSSGSSSSSSGSSSTLPQAAWRGSYDDVRRLRDIEHQEVNIVDHRSYSALHYSAAQGFVDICQYLLENQANVNIRDRYGSTPLFWAVQGGHSSAVEALVDHGANMNLANFYGLTPLHLAILEGEECIAFSLLESGASVHCTTLAGESPLHLAAGTGNAQLAFQMIRLGAFLNGTDEEGETPLHWAVRAGHKNVVELLIKNGAMVDVSNDDSETPLELAQLIGEVEIAEWIVSYYNSNVRNVVSASNSKSTNYSLKVLESTESHKVHPVMDSKNAITLATGRTHQMLIE